jgi:hypothetical protein
VKCWVFLERASEYKFLKGLMHKLGDKHSVQVAICDAEGTNEIPFPVKVLGRGLKAHLFFRTLKCDLLLRSAVIVAVLSSARHLGSAGYSVILRPHEHLQWQKWTLKQKRELAMSGAEIVDNNRGFRGFEESQLMISDGSGVAFEYHLGCGKPVISVLNEQDQFSDFEHQVMRTMGCQILNNETCKIQDAIESLMTNHFQPDPNLIYDFDHNVEDVVHYLGGL